VGEDGSFAADEIATGGFCDGLEAEAAHRTGRRQCAWPAIGWKDERVSEREEGHQALTRKRRTTVVL
jgi:hypothetical protein